MRKNIESAPIQVSIGRIPAGLADRIVAAGEGMSLKGKAVLMQSSAALERLLADLEVNPATADLILRAARLIEARKAAAPPASNLKVSRVAIEDAVADLDLDPEAASDVVRSIPRAQAAVIAGRETDPGTEGNGLCDGK